MPVIPPGSHSNQFPRVVCNQGLPNDLSATVIPIIFKKYAKTPSPFGLPDAARRPTNAPRKRACQGSRIVFLCSKTQYNHRSSPQPNPRLTPPSTPASLSPTAGGRHAGVARMGAVHPATQSGGGGDRPAADFLAAVRRGAWPVLSHAGGRGRFDLVSDYFFPGSLVLILLFTAIFSTISIIEDRREGFLQSVLVAPVPRWSMVLGKVLGGTLLALVQGLIFLLSGLVAGVRFGPVAAIEIVALVFVVALGLTALGFVIAWRMDSTQGFHAIMSVFLMPMWLLSGAFFPAPAWSGSAEWGQRLLAFVMAVNPLTYGVAALRRLLYDGVPGAIGPDTPSLPLAWAVSLGFAAVMLALAWRIAGERTTGDLL